MDMKTKNYESPIVIKLELSTLRTLMAASSDINATGAKMSYDNEELGW